LSSLRTIDFRLIDELVDFVRGRGYVLNFSDPSFSEFFAQELEGLVPRGGIEPPTP
jgi:hypothetical protein